jgi:small-conductance mechanosensitive channel
MPSPAKFDRVTDVLRVSAQPTKKLVRRPRFRRALVTGIGALIVLVVGSTVKGWDGHSTLGHVLFSAVPPILFLALAITCVRAMASELDELARWRGGHAVGSTIRVVVTIVGYGLALLIALGLTSYPIGHLVLGGAIIGVVLGIAAQQSLGNMFAGLVLLAARPFAVGNHIRVRSGSLGGEFYGTVLAMSLTYVTISTTEGLLKVPNSSVLAAAVGPFPIPQRVETDNSNI